MGFCPSGVLSQWGFVLHSKQTYFKATAAYASLVERNCLYGLESNHYEPRCEKTGLRGFRPGPTQIGLYSHRRWLEAGNFVLRK